MGAAKGRAGELGSYVEELVEAATPDANPRELQATVERTLTAFDHGSKDARDSALKTIGRAVEKAEGRGQLILLLTLGAIVEAGASPEIAWPSIAKGFDDLLSDATDFATAAMKHAKDDHVETAIEKSGAVVAKKKPREAAAWNAVPSRCLAAVACLTRSKTVRTKARRETALLERAWSLSDVLPEVGVFLQAVRMLDDTTITVIAPSLGAGWKVAVDSLASNLELHVLLADALLSPTKSGKGPSRLPGKSVDAKAVAAIRDGEPAKKTPNVRFPFLLLPWNVMDEDDEHAAAHAIALEDLPADLPTFNGELVVLLREAPASEPVPIEPTFLGVRPTVRIVEDLAPGVVVKMMVSLAQAAGPAHDHDHDHDHDHAPPSKKKPAKSKAKAKKPAPTKTKKATAKPAKKSSKR